MTEEIATQPEEIIEEQPENWFLEKLKIHKFKILGGVLGALVFTGAVFGAYKFGQKQTQPGSQLTPEAVATPTPNPTTDWKTYNSEIGFSFQYPTEWYIYNRSKEDKNVLELGFSKTQITPGVEPIENLVGIVIFIHPKPLKEFQELLVDEEIDAQLTISGKDAVRISYTGIDGSRNTRVAIGFDNKTLVVSGPSQGNDQLVFNLILSTFKFLPSTDSTGSPQAGSGQGEKVFCKDPRPEVCTMECIVNPPYICGSDGKSYCSECQVCANPEVEWYVTQQNPCEIQ